MNNQINTQQLINFLLDQQQEKSIHINTAYNIFMNHKNIHNRYGTYRCYKATLKPILKYLDNSKIYNSSQVTSDVINKYVLTRKPFVKPQTLNKEVKYFEIMLRYMVKYKYIDKINFTFEPLKVIKTTIPRIEKESIEKILNYFDSSKVATKNKLMFLLILTTGIRTTELINIKNKNIDLEHNIIFLDFTKNGESRNIFIVEQIKELISTVINKTQYLFIDDHNNQMTANAVKQFFKHLKSALDIKVLSPHKLRHYYATNIYNKSLDICLVKELLGHKSIEMTQIYLDINHKDNQIKNSFYSPLNDFRPTD